MRRLLRPMFLLAMVAAPLYAHASGKVFKCEVAHAAPIYSQVPCRDTPVAAPATTAVATQAAPEPDAQPTAAPAAPSRTLAAIDQACQGQTNKISLHYAGLINAIDTQIMDVVRAGQYRSTEGKAQMEVMRVHRLDLDRQRRDELGVVTAKCQADRMAARDTLAANASILTAR